MQIKEDIRLEPHTTFRMGGPVSYFAELSTPEEIGDYAAFAREKGMPLILLGGGSNCIFPSEGTLAACVGKIIIPGFEVLSQDEEKAFEWHMKSAETKFR